MFTIMLHRRGGVSPPIITKDIETHWHAVQPIFSIRNDVEYNKAVETLNGLIDEVGSNEKHPLYELLDTLGTLIHAYEETYYSIPDCSGIDMLKYFMEKHQLGPSVLPELRQPTVVLAILNGKNDLTVKDI